MQLYNYLTRDTFKIEGQLCNFTIRLTCDTFLTRASPAGAASPITVPSPSKDGPEAAAAAAANTGDIDMAPVDDELPDFDA